MSALFSVEAEQLVLGAILLNNDVLAKMPGLEPEHFYDPLHGRMFDTFRGTINGGRTASPVTMRFRLEDDLGEVGGPAYLVRLAGAASLSTAGDIAQHIRDLWARRDMTQAMEEAKARLEDGEGGAVEEIAAELEHRMAANLASASAKPPSHTFRRSLINTVRQVNEAYAGEGAPGVSTGLRALDGVIGSLRPGRSYILAGRPSMGKSAIALGIAAGVAEAGGNVIFASLEMPEEDLTNRLLSRAMRYDGIRCAYSEIEKGELSENEMRAYIDAAKKYEELPWRTIGREKRELSHLNLAIRATVKAHGQPALIVIDHLGLISVRGAKTGFDRVGEASKAMKDLAITLKCPVLVLAQLNREVEARDDKRPRLSDLRQSGEIEEDADVIVMVYRDEYYLERDGVPGGDTPKASEARALYYARRAASKGIIDLGVEKNRGGAVNKVKVKGELEFNWIEDTDATKQEAMDLR